MEVATLKKKLTDEKPIKKKTSVKLSTDLTLLNLGLSGNPSWGILGGHYVLFVGDSQAGKTWLENQLFASAAHNPTFDKYSLIDDKPERGSLMDIARYFGESTAKRLEPPTERGHSKTLEQYYRNSFMRLKEGPCIYGLDSEDALAPESEVKRIESEIRAEKKKEKKIAAGKHNPDDEEKKKGSYGTERAKLNSSQLRLTHNELEEHKSILIIIKQTRKNIGYGSQYNPKTRSGGEALTFYATHELWFSISGKIKKTVNKKKRVQGTILKIHIKKNRVVGQDRIIEIPFYPNVGFDELGSMVRFLVEEGYWSGDNEKGNVVAPEFEFKGDQHDLIALIEENNREKELRLLTVELWNEIEDQLRVTRKKRYQ